MEKEIFSISGHLIMGRLLSARMGHKIILDSIKTATNAEDWRSGGVSQRRLQIEEGAEFRAFVSQDSVVKTNKSAEGAVIIKPFPDRVWSLNGIRYKECEVPKKMWPVIPRGLVVVRHYIGVTIWEVGFTPRHDVYEIVDGEPWLKVFSIAERKYIKGHTRDIPMLLRIPTLAKDHLSEVLYTHYEQTLKSITGMECDRLESVRDRIRYLRCCPYR